MPLLSNNFSYELAFVIWVASIVIFIGFNLWLWRRLRKQTKPTAGKGLIELNSDVNNVASKPKRIFIWNLGGSRLRLPAKTAKYLAIILEIVLISSVSYFAYDLFFHPLGVMWETVGDEANWADQRQPLAIQFDRAFRQDLLVPQIKPAIKGRWAYEHDGIPFLARRVVFYPEESILPGQRVILYLSYVNGVAAQPSQTWDKINEFYSAELPNIVTTVPAAGEASYGTASPVEFELNAPDGDFVEWGVKVEPEVTFELDRSDPLRLRVNFPTPLAQNTKYVVTLNRTQVARNLVTSELISEELPEEVSKLEFTTVRAPALAGSEPSGDKVLPNAQIKLTFDKPMDQASVLNNLKIEPELAVESIWNSDIELLIKPVAPLARDTEYKITVAAGTLAGDGGAIEAAIVHTFRTLGKVSISAISPVSGATRQSLSTRIRITFNQQVDVPSAQSKFSISPSVAGTMAWDQNTMIFTPNGSLAYETQYTFKISAGVKSIYGVDSAQDFSYSFRTRPDEVVLGVPAYSQGSYRYGCNLTAASMALKFKGVTRSVGQLWGEVAKDGTASNWGNPDVGFVGDIYNNGYGVHWGPLGSLIGRYRAFNVYRNWNLTALLREIENGNPVIIYSHNGFAGSGANKTWSTYNGGSYTGKQGMHSYVVRGFKGSPESPSAIYIVDPNGGTYEVWSVGTFNSFWGVFGNTAIVVR